MAFAPRPAEPSRAPEPGFEADVLADVAAAFAACPSHAETPCVPLDGIARELGLRGLWVKDERRRFGLPSFKAAGGAYAVLSIAAEARFGRADSEAVGRLLREARTGARLNTTFAAATAGNHGRAVAAAARLAGCDATIFVSPDVAPSLVAAIEAEGARVSVHAGSYDDAVAACRTRAAAEGWTVVSDTAWDGYESIPRRVMQGYGAIARELMAQAAPSHLFIQAGVGSLAGGMAAALPPSSPRLAVVEPQAAAPLFASARGGRLTESPRGERTVMGRLECYVASPLAWNILRRRADGFLTVTDEEAKAAVARLAAEGLATSPTGAAGLAGLIAAAGDRVAGRTLGLDHTSRVAIILTEPAE